MNLKEIRELVELVTDKAISEFELERAGTRLRIKRETAAAASPVASPAPVATVATIPAPASAPAAAAPAAPAAAVPEPAEDLHTVKSPIVGTFYESPKPGSPAFVKIGDHVKPGQVLCIIEAMKLMNEIESDVAGEVVKRFVENSQPVEYGEPLFAIRKS